MCNGNKVIIDAVLTDMKADLDSTLMDGNYVIHCAAQFYEGFLPLLVLLKQFKIDVNRQDIQGGSALHFAVTEGEHKNIEVLLSHGADVNLKDNEGRTPLHQAVTRWIGEIKDPEFLDSPDLYKEIIKELLFAGADRQETNNEGQTAIEVLEDYHEHKDEDETE
jgi:ankyrin repeat protein